MVYPINGYGWVWIMDWIGLGWHLGVVSDVGADGIGMGGWY